MIENKINYYNDIKNKLIDNEIYARVKDYSKERNRVITYYEVWKILSKAGSKYGENIIGEYSKKLMLEVGKKYNERNLRYMRRFYDVFSSINWNPLGSKLCWSHYRELLSIKNTASILYYIEICERNNLSKRELQDKIKSHEYDRLSNNIRDKLINKKQVDIKDLIPNPIIIKNTLIDNSVSEYALKQLILNNLDEFLLQLGNGYTYVRNEYKIKHGDRYNYIDLLLFNYEYNCFVVVELKVTELKKEHIGQIEIYMNYIDDNLRKINQDKTIGIIICKENNKYVIKYCSDKRIIASEYELI